MSAQSRRVGLQLLDDVGAELPTAHVVDLGHRVRDRLGRRLLEIPRRLRRGRATLRTVVVLRCDRLVTVATGAPRVLRRVRLVSLNDAGLLEDGLVVLFGRDVLVGRPHVGVDLPVDAVLDFRACVALADHPRDGGVAEVVRVDRLLDAGVVGRAFERRPKRRRREGSALRERVVAVARHLVEQGDVVLVGARMRRPEVLADRGLRVDDGVLADLCALQPERLGVRDIRGSLALEVDVADAERPTEREAGAGVGEELDDGDVAQARRPASEGVDVFGLEHVLGRDLRIRRRGQLVVFGPGEIVTVDLVADVGEELSDDELDVADGAVGHATATTPVLVAVSELVDMPLHVGLGQRRDRLVETLPGHPEVAEVLCEARLLKVAIGLDDPPLDERFVIGMVAVELREFVIQALGEALEVIQPAHTPMSESSIKNPSSGKIGFLETTGSQKTPARRVEPAASPPTVASTQTDAGHRQVASAGEVVA